MQPTMTQKTAIEIAKIHSNRLPWQQLQAERILHSL